jgi:hypothetical protein
MMNSQPFAIFAAIASEFMKHHNEERIQQMPSKGGIVGALTGVIAAVFYYKPGDKALSNAGKTALFSGAGFLIGNWFEKKVNHTGAKR